MFGVRASLFAIVKYFSFAFFPFATQLFSTSVTSSNLRYLRSSAFYRAPSKNVQLLPKLASTHNNFTLVTAQSHSKNAFMRRTLTQQKLITPSEYRSAVQVGSVKPISPPPNWPQQSTFETRRHDHLKCCSTCKLKPLFWKSHAARKHLLCGSQQTFNKTSSVASPKIGGNC